MITNSVCAVGSMTNIHNIYRNIKNLLIYRSKLRGIYPKRNKSIELHQSIELEPSYRKYYIRGLIKVGLKDYVGAKKDFEKVIELKPNKFNDNYLKKAKKAIVEITDLKKYSDLERYSTIKESISEIIIQY